MSNEPIRVLLVEDSVVEARLLQELLKESQVPRFDVVLADRLSVALAALENADFDVILLDLTLPDGNGIETFRRLQWAVQNIPIVVLTGLEDETLAAIALQEGAQDYLTKQYSDARTIHRAIRYAMQRKLAERERLQLIHEQAVKTQQLEIEQAARREAEKANDLKLRFLAMISHELRTPLASIKGFVSTLLAEDVAWDRETQASFLRIIEQETDKLTDLVEQLLDLGRMEAGTLRIEAHQHHIDDVLEMASVQLQTLAADHRLDIDTGDGLPPVMVDALRIAQVLVNLVSNAVRYSPPNTPVHIRARLEGESIQIDVQDHGEGIAPDIRPYVFEAFRQGDRNSARRKGAGLGLAICKGIVENHNGRIWIQDHDGPGTIVSFTLPVVRQPVM